MKDHQIAAVVNQLRDIAVTYHDHQSLRERIAQVVRGCKPGTDKVQILVTQQGDAACGEEGYMLKRSDNVAAFYLDGWGSTGRIYPVASAKEVFIDGQLVNFPELIIENGEDESVLTTVCFPEYKGWRVHCTGGGKTMAVCLVKD